MVLAFADGAAFAESREEFGLRHKDFWPLEQTPKLLSKFMKQLTHESDGLIFQPVRFWEGGCVSYCARSTVLNVDCSHGYRTWRAAEAWSGFSRAQHIWGQ